MRRLLLLAALVAAPLSAQQGPTLEDLFRARALGDLDLSPDGSRVLYTARAADLEANETNTDVWLVPTGGGEPVRMTRSTRPDTDPRWAPDGRSLVFHAVNPPGYRDWTKLVLPMIDNTIAAARAVGATILLPGTV